MWALTLQKKYSTKNDDSVTNYITGSYPSSVSILESNTNEIINISKFIKIW